LAPGFIEMRGEVRKGIENLLGNYENIIKKRYVFG